MTILTAAEQLQHYQEIQFALVGNGADKAALISYAHQHQLQNVVFLDPLPHESVPMLLNAADVCLAHTKKLPLFEGMLPIKMYEAMACARPLLLALNGEARRIAVEDAGAAIYVEPENAQALAAAIIGLYHSPTTRQKLGFHGHNYIQGRFDYDTLTEQLHMQIRKLLQQEEKR
jgi:glycosyltransferase involved in cell wall biosynthesis